MNIEEAIRIIKSLKVDYNKEQGKGDLAEGIAEMIIDFDDIEAIETLLTAYEKEKKKNKKLEKFIKNGEYTWKQKYNETFKYFKEELEKEKEKNKSLLQCLKDSQERCENEHLFLGNPDM